MLKLKYGKIRPFIVKLLVKKLRESQPPRYGEKDQNSDSMTTQGSTTDGSPQLITSGQAFNIAINYLGEQIRGRFEISTSLPANIYNRERLKGSWVVRVPSCGLVSTLGAGRIICISRKTGEILYDGSDGGE